jgi:hypothetical protein
MQGAIGPSGRLTMKKIPPKKAPLSWRLKNAMRLGFLLGWVNVQIAKGFSRLTGIPTITSSLRIKKRCLDGTWIDYGVVGYRVVTNAGVAFLVDDWDDNTASATNDITTMKYHGCGTGGTAEAAGDTALVTESTTALNPDNTRATGTQSQPSSNILQSVGTVTFDATAAITEHGLFSQAATGGGTLWDRTLFSVVNMASGEQLQFTYQCTINSGG